jgi:hypothetical protein
MINFKDMPLHSRVWIYKIGQGKIISCPISELENLLIFSEGQKGITVFNNLVNTKAALEQNWEVPLEKS